MCVFATTSCAAASPAISGGPAANLEPSCTSPGISELAAPFTAGKVLPFTSDAADPLRAGAAAAWLKAEHRGRKTERSATLSRSPWSRNSIRSQETA